MDDHYVLQINRDGVWGWTVERTVDDEHIEMFGFYETRAQADAEAQRRRMFSRLQDGEM